jgi:hypothetical protein
MGFRTMATAVEDATATATILIELEDIRNNSGAYINSDI